MARGLALWGIHNGCRKSGSISAPIMTVTAARTRSAARMTQAEFAARIGVPVETVRNWEQGRRAPTGPGRALLRAIRNDPLGVVKALAR